MLILSEHLVLLLVVVYFLRVFVIFFSSCFADVVFSITIVILFIFLSNLYFYLSTRKYMYNFYILQILVLNILEQVILVMPMISGDSTNRNILGNFLILSYSMTFFLSLLFFSLDILYNEVLLE